MNFNCRQNLYNILSNNISENFRDLLSAAHACRLENLGDFVYLRGLIEYSNCCELNCFYCGLRKDNRKINRYHLNSEVIHDIARAAWEQGYQSLALQSGEIGSDKEIDFLAGVISRIKEATGGSSPESLGITLSVGELSYQQYLRLWEAGAHRYLLRIESSNRNLFARIHPPSQSFARRLECLDALKEIGFQVGTGVMIGLPGQTYEDLAQDLLFFKDRDIDMLGMGPYIPHPRTPLAGMQQVYRISNPYLTTLKMMALARLLMPDINMVASTALQTLHPEGLKMGLKAGANIVMPVLTPETNRNDYAIYANKQYKNMDIIKTEIETAGFRLGCQGWGDSLHYYRRQGLPYPR